MSTPTEKHGGGCSVKLNLVKNMLPLLKMCPIQAPDCLGLFTALSNSGLPLLCRLFLGTDSSAASSPVRETPRSPPTGSSGESMDSVSVSSSDSSSPSDSEGLTPTHSSDSQQNKVGYYKVNNKRIYSNPLLVPLPPYPFPQSISPNYGIGGF